ncbi:MAG: class I SAM-dependent methyltransferase [bacterium]|nr:class I SAM-dependent methyltransferase [bacterium]
MANLIIYILGLILLLITLTAAASIIFSVLSFAPWVPSRARDLKRIFKLAGLKPGQIFYDLGCGNGRVAVYAADNCEAKAIGLEICLPLYLVCKLREIFRRGKNIKFKLKNLYKENLAGADVVYFFGMPHRLNAGFKRKLAAELKPGAKVISYSFKFDDWKPAAIDKPSDNDLPIYLYVI